MENVNRTRYVLAENDGEEETGRPRRGGGGGGLDHALHHPRAEEELPRHDWNIVSFF